jgi:GDP-L-fucose synthase
MKVIILGGHGFVGKSVAHQLKESKYDVFPLSRRDGLDLLDIECTKSLFLDIQPNVIINCAAHGGSLHYVTEFAGDVIYDNIEMALNLYKSVKDVCPEAKIINPLSNCSYPGDAHIQRETEWWNGEVHDSVFSYGNAKRFIYVISKNFQIQYGINTINYLVPNTFGPGDYTDPNKTHALNGMIIRMIIAQKNKEQTFEIWGTGNPVREWAYIKDVANILKEGITIDRDLIYPVNIAQNKGYSIKESAKFIAEAVGFEGKLLFNTKYQDGAPIKILDDKMFRSFNPDYEFFDHGDGIKETVKYYKQNL